MHGERSVKILLPFIVATLCVCALANPALSEQSVDMNKLLGSYTDSDKRFATVRSLCITKAKDGTIKVSGKLSGFPDDVDLGEASVETWVQRDRGDWQLLLSFSSGRFKPFMVVSVPRATPPSQLSVTCYLKGNNQPAEYFETTLSRDKDSK